MGALTSIMNIASTEMTTLKLVILIHRQPVSPDAVGASLLTIATTVVGWCRVCNLQQHTAPSAGLN